MEKENAPDTTNEDGKYTEDTHSCGEADTEDCPLDVFTPQALINKLNAHEDCTDELISLIKTVRVNQTKMKKLCKVFCALRNCNTDAIVELTRDRNRMLRHISTYLVLSKIKQWIEEEKGFGIVEKMYDEVFLVRFRDVDFNIRAMCVDFMCEWTIAAPRIFNKPCYLKYIGWALSDKNDTVRRKALNACIRLITTEVGVETFVSRFKSRIVEVALYDRSHALREEGRNLCMISYLHDLLDKVEIYVILSSMREKDKKGRLKEVLAKILSENYVEDEGSGLLGNLDGLHELVSSIPLFLCSCIPHEDRHVLTFMDFILKFLCKKSSCCRAESLCYLKILNMLSGSVSSISKYCELLETVKDNKENMIEVLKCINNTNVEVFRGRPDVTNKIIDTGREICTMFKCERMCALLVQLLKKLEDDFRPTVGGAVEHLKSTGMHAVRCIIKFFDISGDVREGHPTDIKLYAILWRILSGDYEYVNSCELVDTSDVEIICDFLIFLKGRCVEFGVLNEDVGKAFDHGTAFKVTYGKLSVLLHMHANKLFTEQKTCIFLFKLLEEDLLVEHSNLIFERCDEELVLEFINRSKSRINLLSGYFKYLMTVEPDVSLTKISKLMVSKCASSKKLVAKEKVVFKGVKEAVDRKKTFLYDSVLVHFVSLLSINECIVVEQGVCKSKFKSSLVRRIKGRGAFKSSPIGSSLI